jgi:hypothetical protein
MSAFSLRVCFLVAAAPALAASLPERVSFNQHIRPILSDKCFACHGTDSKKRKAGLRLDEAESALKPNDEGVPAIKPGDANASGLWQRVISNDEEEVMPPPKTNKPLSAQEKELLKRWIEQGAPFQRHWAFEAPVKVEPPPAVGARNPIDQFVRARLAAERLAHSPEADDATLIRRVAFALTGLPPTAEEVETFLNDESDRNGAYGRLVDRYLASPRFGEEMARHWLDVARYGDTHGLHLDNERQMWAYRDWVIQAFNGNKPFDQFTVEQLAGDLLPNPTREQLIATGFNRCNVTTSEGGAIDAEFIYRYAVDRASTTADAWLGLTAGCAVCHDHKYDPLSMKEFYSLYAFFNSNADPAMDGNALLTAPTLKLTAPEQQKKLADFDAQIGAAQQQLHTQIAAVAYTDPATLTPPPPVRELETVWVDDDFPAGAKWQASPGAPTQWVDAKSGVVFSGARALKRTDKGLAQDFYEGGAAPIEIPPGAELFAHVWIDPADPPKTIMLQYHKGGWLHRAVWGDYEAIQWGAPGTTERVHAGPLPEASKWVRLAIDAAKLGLNAGDQITGVAFTQFGGTIFWDKAGVAGRSDPAADPSRSLLAWWKQRAGKDTQGVPPEINKLLKDGPDKAHTPEQQKNVRDYFLQNICSETKAQFAAPIAKLAKLRKDREEFDKAIPSTFIYRDLDKPRDSFVMLRGQYDKPGDKVEPAVPAVFPPLKKADPNARATRLDLARWLVAPEHPLAARVTVNRFWQQFFGTGLVKTSYDFGSQGEMPSHPELLDWLAVTFRESGWDTKSLVRLLVTSATFRQSTAAPAESWTRDPENRLLSRGPRFRLDAEQIRDNALFVGGLLNFEMGGKSVKPYQPPNIWEPLGYADSNTRFYKQDTGSALYRRSIYCFIKRTAPPPFMANFDAPNREQFCTRRERSNTPLQALQLMNDVQHFEAARGFAERIMTAAAATADRIAFAYRTILARPPAPEEIAIVQAALEKHLAKFQQTPDAAKKVIRNGESKPNPKLPEPELAAWTMIGNLLLNLDETVTRN